MAEYAAIRDLPGRLCRLRPVSGGRLERELRCVRESTIYLSTFDQLNDPFEFTAEFDFESSPEVISASLRSTEGRTGVRADIQSAVRDSRSPYRRLQLQQMVLESTRSWGVYCLSSEFVDEAMWAYYGESHAGIAIILDSTPEMVLRVVPPLFPLRVEYSDTPPTVRYWEIPADELARACRGTKSVNWRHEREWRLVGPEAGLFEVPRGMISGLAVGLRTSSGDRRRVSQVAEECDLELFEVVKVPSSYTLQLNRI